MNTRTFMVAFVLLTGGTDLCIAAQVKMNARSVLSSWPAPQGEKLSEDYTLRINDQNVPVYTCRVSAEPLNQVWPGFQRPMDQTEMASFAYWDMSGPVTVEVSSSRSFRSVAVRPISRGVPFAVKGRTIRLQLAHPGQLTVELDGIHRALHLFADPPETDAPKAGDAHVLYFGPGVHRPGRVKLESGETVYVAGGAVVYAAISGRGLTGVRILGRGIIDTSEFVRGEGGFPENMPEGSIRLSDSTDIRIEGVILRDSSEYGISCYGCRGVSISRIKEIGFWRYNTDGIDICNSEDVDIRDSFVRSFDDSIVIKGIKGEREDFSQRPTRNIRASNLVLWCDWGRALEVGAETSTPEIADVAFRDTDVIRSEHIAMDIQHSDRAAIHDIHFENIRVELDDVTMQPVGQESRDQKYVQDPLVRYVPQLFVIIIRPTRVSSDDQVGTVHGVTLKDIFVTGKPVPESSLTGFDAQHDVRDVSIENLRFNGRPATSAEAAHIKLNGFAAPVHFLQPAS